MVGNQARVNHLTRESTAQVSLSRDLQQAALDARIKLNELISIDRDLRLARTSADVNFVLQQMASRAADANQAYDGAVTIAAKDEDKLLLKRAKAAFNDYVATAQEIARLQHEIIGLRDRQLADAAAWSGAFDTLINGAAIATSANRHALESNLQQANSEFMRGALLSWSRFVRSDSTQVNRIFDALGTTTLLLEESRGMMRRPDERAAIEELLKYPPRYRSIVENQTRAVQQQTDLLLERAQPQRADASDTMGLVAIGANQHAD